MIRLMCSVLVTTLGCFAAPITSLDVRCGLNGGSICGGLIIGPIAVHASVNAQPGQYASDYDSYSGEIELTIHGGTGTGLFGADLVTDWSTDSYNPNIISHIK